MAWKQHLTEDLWGIQVLRGEMRLNTHPGSRVQGLGLRNAGTAVTQNQGSPASATPPGASPRPRGGENKGFPPAPPGQKIQRSEILNPGLAPGRPAGDGPQEGELLFPLSPPSAAPDNHRLFVNWRGAKQQERKESLTKGGLFFFPIRDLLESLSPKQLIDKSSFPQKNSTTAFERGAPGAGRRLHSCEIGEVLKQSFGN